jgi:hypothetical protein
MSLVSGQPPGWVRSGWMYCDRCAAVPRLAVSPAANGLLALRCPRPRWLSCGTAAIVMTAPAARPASGQDDRSHRE